ncbi:MAG: hypothetical protein AAGD32_08640 [Planctomycetota bacterium]
MIGCGLLAGCGKTTSTYQRTETRTTLGEPVQLTTAEQFDAAGEAYFCPDTRHLIFQAKPLGEAHYQMYLAELQFEGEQIVGLSEPVRITPEGSRNTCGYFHPTQPRILYASTLKRPDSPSGQSGYQREGGDYEWDFDAAMEIYTDTLDEDGLPTKKPIALTDNDAYDAEGAYSPDGNNIIFTSDRDGDLELYAMRADGTGVVRLTDAPGYDGGPFVNPDNSKVIWRADYAGNDLLQIMVGDLVRNADGDITGMENIIAVTDNRHVNWGPFWHPSGEFVAYATSEQGHRNYEVYRISLDGTGKQRVTDAPGFDGLPVFDPTGKWMLWTAKRPVSDTDAGTSQLYVAPFDGSATRVLR